MSKQIKKSKVFRSVQCLEAVVRKAENSGGYYPDGEIHALVKLAWRAETQYRLIGTLWGCGRVLQAYFQRQGYFPADAIQARDSVINAARPW